MPRVESDADLRELIGDAKTIAIVGLSPKEHRDSFRVAKYLQDQGYRIIPVNPNANAVLGETACSSLSEVTEKVDIVDVFRRPDAVEEVARDAVSIGARALWLQIGVVNESAAEIAEEGGLAVVMDRRLMVDHGRLMR
ncbi:MAG: CoA-binding protein [Thermomicrobiaceae bacterium]